MVRTLEPRWCAGVALVCVCVIHGINIQAPMTRCFVYTKQCIQASHLSLALNPTTVTFVYFIHACEVDLFDLVVADAFHAVHTRFGILSSYLIGFLLEILVVDSNHIHHHILNIDSTLFHIVYSGDFGVYGKLVVVRNLVTVVTTRNDIRAVHDDTSMLVEHSTLLSLYDCFLDVQVMPVHIR